MTIIDSPHTSAHPPERKPRVAMQGEPGSNSHMAVVDLFAGQPYELYACAHSVDVFERLLAGAVDTAVLPIENSLHGSVAEHFDLMLQHGVRIVRERTQRIRHNLITAAGTDFAGIRRVLSHPVALSQCRAWLHAHPGLEAVPFYDTAGAVKHVVAEASADSAAIAPALAAEIYGGVILESGIEDHQENYTRFLVLETGLAEAEDGRLPVSADKFSVAFSLVHRPGSLLSGLQAFETTGVNLTKLESRPVPGKPWEYIFYVDARFEDPTQVRRTLALLLPRCGMVKLLGIYPAG